MPHFMQLGRERKKTNSNKTGDESLRITRITPGPKGDTQQFKSSRGTDIDQKSINVMSTLWNGMSHFREGKCGHMVAEVRIAALLDPACRSFYRAYLCTGR